MSWIVTGEGLTRFDYYNSSAADVSPKDLIRSLSRTARFRGLGLYFYSVAQHSILVAYLALLAEGFTTLKELTSGEFSFRKYDYACRLVGLALLHDGPEAYMADLAQPLKALLPGYRAIEDELTPLVYGRFGLENISDRERDVIKMADMQACLIERDFLFPMNRRNWEFEDLHPGHRFSDFFSRAWAPDEAAHHFELHIHAVFPWLNGNENVH